jgi:hypothetical protein
MLRATLLLAVVCAVPSCIPSDVEDTVLLTAEVRNVQVAVALAPGGLVTTLAGGFDVALHLRERGSVATDVTFTSFSLVRADNDAQVLNAPTGKPLSWEASPPLPAHLIPGGDASVHVTIGSGKPSTMELSAEDKAAVCAAGQVKIVGTLQDTAQGARVTSLASGPIVPSGC